MTEAWGLLDPWHGPTVSAQWGTEYHILGPWFGTHAPSVLSITAWPGCRPLLVMGSKGWSWWEVCLWSMLVMPCLSTYVNHVFKYVNPLEKCWVVRGWEA